MERTSIYEISQEPLEDLLLALELAESSVDLCLESAEGAATVSVRKGRLAGAEFGDRSGSDALYSVLSLSAGKYQVKKADDSKRIHPTDSLGNIVRTRLQSIRVSGLPKNRSWPPVAACLERTGTPLPKNLSALELRALAQVNGKLTALDIAAQEKGSPAETLSAIRSLTGHGLVRPVRAETLSLGTNLVPKELVSSSSKTLHSLGAVALPAEEPPPHAPSVTRKAPPSQVPSRVAGPAKGRPMNSGYSSVPPTALAEEHVQLPRSLRPDPLTNLDEPMASVTGPRAEAPRSAHPPASPKPVSSVLNAATVTPDQADRFAPVDPTSHHAETDRKPSSKAPRSERRPSSSRIERAPIVEAGPDPAVVAAAEGQLRDSELPLPSSRLGRDALYQLDELNEAVQSSRAPNLPSVHDNEISQDYAIPGSVPHPEQLPGAETAPGDSELPHVGRYEILARLKRGGMGSVYMCRLSGNAGFRRLFAMKVLHGHLAEQDGAVESFFHEARVLGGMHHRNIVGIADVGSPEQPYIVLDYVEGGSLAELYRAAPKSRDPGLVVRIALDALSGLAAAHAEKDENGNLLSLVHCDVTPHNLLVGVDGTCRVTDFGIARTGEGNISREITRGKPGYLAPERLKRTGNDQRADLFSLGVVLYAGLTGIEPFAADNPDDTMRNVLSKVPTPPSEVGLRPPPALDWVCMKALAKDPAERFQTADEMADQLRRIAEREGLLGGSSGVAAWLEEALAPTLAARRTASLRGTVPPEARYQPSTIPPPAEYLTAPADAPSALEHTGPLDPPSSNFNDRTEVIKMKDEAGASTTETGSKKKPLLLYLAIAAAMLALVWSVLRPDSHLLGKPPEAQAPDTKTSIQAIKNAADEAPEPPAEADPDQITLPEITPRKARP